VALGREYTPTADMSTLTAPPSGYHSVLGKPITHSKLNFEENVVYEAEAVLPMFVVVYSYLCSNCTASNKQQCEC
jgi:hypothetical protein